MKVGSLVVLEGNGETPSFPHISVQKGVIYTVTDIFKNVTPPYEDLITIAEMPVVFNPNTGDKMGYEADNFREIQPPMDVTALIEECKTETV
jgi:hypothetical protein